MPRYYFNVCSDEAEVTDLVGTACNDDLDALQAAFRIASEVVQTRLFRNQPVEEGWISVEDDGDREVLVLPLRAAAY